MKARVMVENLKKGLGIVGGTVARHSTLPILGHIVVEAGDGSLLLKSGNIEAYTVCRVTAKVDEPGDVALPAKLLTDLVGSYPNEAATLDQEGDGIRLECKRRRPLIRGMPTVEFPILPQPEDTPLAIFDPAELQTALLQVCVSAAVDESRPVLTGVNFAFENDGLEMAAADGFRLSVRYMAVQDVDKEEDETLSLIIPAVCLARLIKLLGDEEEPVRLYRCNQEGILLFRLAGGKGANLDAVYDIDLFMSSIAGVFVDYQGVADFNSGTLSRATVSTDALIETCKSAALFARDGADLVKITLFPNTVDGNGGMSIQAQSDVHGDYEDTLDAEVTEDGGALLCNVRFFLDALAVMRGDQVSLCFTGEDKGFHIEEVGYDDYFHLIMTMRLKAWKG